MSKEFANSLLKLVQETVQVFPCSLDEGTYDEDECGSAPLCLSFKSGAILRMDYWRLIEAGKSTISSFDHRQKYGLPERIDALAVIKERLDGKLVTSATADSETGDLCFEFERSAKLQVFNFTGYEIWELKFPNGAVEYSNYFEKGS